MQNLHDVLILLNWQSGKRAGMIREVAPACSLIAHFNAYRTMDLASFPRAPVCHRPTPLEEMKRLSAELGGPRLWVKRDDCTGLATGGNKARKLEFLMGEAIAEGAELVVTQGAVQSNHVRQTAAACCKLGLQCHILLERRVPHVEPAYEKTGNVLLDRLFGASIEFREGGLDMNAEAQAVTEQFQKQGRQAYFIPGGGSNTTGALGYVNCAVELTEQAQAQGMRIDWVVHGTGSTGTQAGLVAGFHGLNASTRVLGVSVRQKVEVQRRNVHLLAAATAERLSLEPLPMEKVEVEDGYIGEGYGIPAAGTLEAIRKAAQLEGLLLDPVYSGKGMDGLINLTRQGFFKQDETVVFLHTGGAAALFAYENVLL